MIPTNKKSSGSGENDNECFTVHVSQVVFREWNEAFFFFFSFRGYLG